MRFIPIALGLALTVTAGIGLRVLDPGQSPAARARKADNPQSAVLLYREALRRDSASPYRWADLADALRSTGDIAGARRAYEQAHQIAPGTPQILIRAASFFAQLDEPAALLRAAGRALRLVPDFDAILFMYLDRLVPEPENVLAEIGTDRRSARAYTEYLIASGRMDAARSAWGWCRRHGYADDRFMSSYIDSLLRAKLVASAQRDWVDYLDKNRGDYPSSNLVYNGGFERNPTGSAFDWRITPSEQFDTARDRSATHDGKWSLRVQFRGTANVRYANVVQMQRVTPGKYRFEAWVKTDSVTTDQPPQFHIYDPEQGSRLNVCAGVTGGTNNWTHIDQPFTVRPETNLIALELLREPSMKFDNRISGTVWIDSVALLPD